MTMHHLPPTQELHELFLEEASAMGRARLDVCDDGLELYARAVFSAPVEVRPGDAVRGGVALRALGELVDVHPFVYRQVCTNGAIVSSSLESKRIQRVGMAAPTVAITSVLAEVRLALRGCAHPTAFADGVEAMRRATRQPATELMPVMRALAQDLGIEWGVLGHALVRFASDGDTSAFGLVNAITALAREIRNRDLRWRLEELGGGMLARIAPVRKPGPVQEEALVDACA